MPAFRNIRRSRRISKQPPRDPNLDEYDAYDMQLLYPDPDPASSSSSPTFDAPLPFHGGPSEKDIDPRSPPPSSPAHSRLPRSSHSRKKQPGHIPRPPNAFLIFRSELWRMEKIKKTVEKDHRRISVIAGQIWQTLSDAQRAQYHAKADEAKRQHALKYPDYKYSPVYRKDKTTKRKIKLEDLEKVRYCEQVAKLVISGFEGDDLTNEVQRVTNVAEDDYTSDAPSEYTETRRHRKPHKPAPKRLSSAQRPRRCRTIPTSGTEGFVEKGRPSASASVVEPTLSCAYDVPMTDSPHNTSAVDQHPPTLTLLGTSHDLVTKTDSYTPRQAVSRALSHHDRESSFVLHDEIPEISLGSPAFRPKAGCIDRCETASFSPDSDHIGLFSCDPFTQFKDPSPPPDFMDMEATCGTSMEGFDVFANDFDFSCFEIRGVGIDKADSSLIPGSDICFDHVRHNDFDSAIDYSAWIQF